MATAPFENNPFLHTDIPRALLCPYCGFFCNDSERVAHHIEQKHIKPYRDFFTPEDDEEEEYNEEAHFFGGNLGRI